MDGTRGALLAFMWIRRWVLSAPLVTLIAVAACGGDVTGGNGIGTCAPVPIHCANGCRYGVVGSDAPTCVDGAWVCPSPGPVCADGGASDASSNGDATSDARADAPIDAARDVFVLDAAAVACGPTLVCANAASFCQESSGGPPPPPDAGSGVGYSCEPFPAACATDHSCACLRANGVCSGALADCQMTGAGIVVSCAFP